MDIFEETHMTKLIQLVMTDGLMVICFLISAMFALEVPIAATPEPEAYFGCRAEFVNHVRITFFFYIPSGSQPGCPVYPHINDGYHMHCPSKYGSLLLPVSVLRNDVLSHQNR